MNKTPHNFCTTGKEVLNIELDAIKKLEYAFNEDFHKACEILFACQGRVIVIGIGKSGHIANKIASTLASTGTPAFFIHPAEASHGDLGMITKQDAVVMISSSGYTEEILCCGKIDKFQVGARNHLLEVKRDIVLPHPELEGIVLHKLKESAHHLASGEIVFQFELRIFVVEVPGPFQPCSPHPERRRVGFRFQKFPFEISLNVTHHRHFEVAIR